MHNFVYFLAALQLVFVLFLYLSNRHLGFMFLLFVGVLYYFVSPYVMYTTGFIDSFPGISQWHGSFSKSELEYRVLIYCSFFYLVFISLILNFFERINFVCLRLPKITSFTLFTSLIGMLIILFSIWFRARGLLFKGYSSEYNTSLMGQMATFNLLINFLVMYANEVGKKRIALIGGVGLVVNSVLLLGMGGRMYVVTILCSWFLLYVNRISLSRKLKITGVAVASVFFFSFLGAWRLGISDISFVPYILFAEPVFTSYSSSSFIGGNELPFFGHIQIFLNSFVGLLPSFFVPDKADFYTVPYDLGYSYVTPLGATSLVVYFLVSFGLVGGLFFLVLLACFFSWVKKMSFSNELWLTIYCTSLSVVPFIFFRETFYVSVRAALLPGLIFPCILLAFDWVVRGARK